MRSFALWQRSATAIGVAASRRFAAASAFRWRSVQPAAAINRSVMLMRWGGAIAPFHSAVMQRMITPTPLEAAAASGASATAAADGSATAAAGGSDDTIGPEPAQSWDQPNSNKFRLTPNFVAQFKDKPAPFGYNGLGELVYRRTYSRTKEDGSNEQWYETVERVVNGTYNMQKKWIEQHHLGWNPWQAQKSAQEMFRRIFEMKFLPPGRGLWAMGSQLTEQRAMFAALNNCAFVSTDSMKREPTKPFTFLMDASMLGVGVGFDTKGAGTVTVKGPASNKPTETYVIPDTREGWVEALRLTLYSYFHGTAPYQFDVSQIRPAGRPIKVFCGIASGPGVLVDLIDDVRKTLNKELGKPISVTSIVDIMNLIGRCVVAGNVRRTAEIAFGAANSMEYLNLKNYKVNPQRAAFGWTSNNSVFATLGMDYSDVCERVRSNGEPGFAWLENMRNFGRMNGTPDTRDSRAQGGNPCLEQTLESYELCCLVETFPTNHTSLEDYETTLKFAYLYAKTVTLGQTHWPETNRVMLRNRRIGCSVSGVAQFISQRGIEQLRQWLDAGYNTIQRYDKSYSEWFAIPQSIKTTSVKPSGTVSLLAGATPGMHYPESRFYIRRVRLSKNSELIKPLKKAGYHIEPAVDAPNDTLVVSVPIDAGAGVRTAREVSMWEQLSLAALLQRHWADNQVSCTVTFDPKTEAKQLESALNYFQYQLKGISFLPRIEKGGAYAQMPYEEITESEYQTRLAALKPLRLSSGAGTGEAPIPERFCDSDVCGALGTPATPAAALLKPGLLTFEKQTATSESAAAAGGKSALKSPKSKAAK